MKARRIKVDYLANIIVDVPAMQTDTPYSYLVSKALGKNIQPGMRVAVPFGKGNRKVQGFVMSIEERSDDTIVDHLKEIDTVFDLTPVLNEELLVLAEEMKRRTFSFKITCLQTMLPSVMKASYRKWIRVIDEIPEEIKAKVFHYLDEVSFDEVENSGYLPEIMKLKQEEKVEIRYEVKSKNRVKTIQAFSTSLTFERLEEERMMLRKTAKKKNQLLLYLQSLDGKSCTIKEATKNLGISRQTIKEGEKQGWLTITEQEIYRDPYKEQLFEQTIPLKLTHQQELAYQKTRQAIDGQQATTFLLEGITGSGKTEVYLQSIAHALEKGKSAILLVPEISLTPQMVQRFKGRFGDEVAVLHSGLSQGEKYDEWRKIEQKDARVVVGARSAIFAPIENLGIIIIDEEHETSYKQEETPRYHARDLAIWRSKYHHCPVVLGSATPSLESRARAQKGVYELLVLDERANPQATLPEVEIVDMRKEYRQQTGGTFSTKLLKEIQFRLDKKEQTVLMLNRRGYSSFLMCRDCGYVLPCPNCDISLTFHMDTKKMKCHYCGHEEPIPHACPVCSSKKIRYYGTGTQKVEEELKKNFPTSNIIRMDVDTTRKKGAHEKLLQKFGNQEADILLGTQMIAKGLDFPNVTLVGVLNADTALNLPDFRASEKTFQLLTQVSGRAGRADKKGEVIVQTFNPQHYAIQFAQNQDFEGFYKREMQIRHQGNYPPYFFTVQIITNHEEETVAAKKMFQIVQQLKQVLSPQSILLGPTPKAVLRVNNRYFYQTVIKYKNEPQLEPALRTILEESQHEIRRGLRLSIDVEPMNFI